MADPLVRLVEIWWQAIDDFTTLLETVPAADALTRIESAQWLEEQPDLDMALLALRSLLRDVAALSAGIPGEHLLNSDVGERVAAVARGTLGPRVLAAWEATAEAQTALRGNANKPLTMDVLVDAVAG